LLLNFKTSNQQHDNNEYHHHSTKEIIKPQALIPADQ
jgi:hypothetical protein